MRPVTADQSSSGTTSGPAADAGSESAPAATRAGDRPADVAGVVAAAAAGDEAAWETLVVMYGRRIYAMARSRLGDAESAEEIAQSVFATLAERLRSGDGSAYDERGRFESWLFRITMNRVRDEGRRRQRRAGTSVPLEFVDPSDEPACRRTEPVPVGESEHELGRLRDALSRLDDKDREIIGLRHHGGLSFAQIAETLGEPMGTVLARHHRALKKIRKDIEAQTAGPEGERG